MSTWQSDVVERADVRVRQLRDGLRLALEALPRVGRRGDLGRQNLDGDDAIEARVAGFVDLAHPARADGRLNLIGPETCSGREPHAESLHNRRRHRGGCRSMSAVQFVTTATGCSPARA